MKMSKLKLFFVFMIVLFFIGAIGVAGIVYTLGKDLPEIIAVKDYKPLLVSEVYDRNNKKIGEFSRDNQKRIITPMDKIPDIVKKAFISAEDASFYTHSGVNFVAIIRAFIANLKAGRKAQGGSTITMQVAKNIVLKDKKKKYSRKIKEILLSFQMEKNLSKDEILFLYLNQIFLGHGAYGIGMASETYFRKPIAEITLKEAALLAGLPQAPSRYTPVYKPKEAKNRQIYVLKRMAEEGYITEEQAKEAINSDLIAYTRIEYDKQAPFFLETLRQAVVKFIGNDPLLDEGLKIYTGLDIEKQKAAQQEVRKGLKTVDKRQGFRGPKDNITEVDKIKEFLTKVRDKFINEHTPLKIIKPDGTIHAKKPLNLTGKDENGKPLPVLPKYIKVGDTIDAIVTEVDDKLGITKVRFAESKGIIDFNTMTWARKPNPKTSLSWGGIKKPSKALKKGDIIEVKIISDDSVIDRFKRKYAAAQKKDEWPKNFPKLSEFAQVELDQDPGTQGALLSLDNDTGEILAMVGGYDYNKSKYNCSIQAQRQSGSAFKAFVYASAMDRGYTPASVLIDAPLVFTEKDRRFEGGIKKWKPKNYGRKFEGDILLRHSFARSLNIPTVKIIQDLGVPWVADYARRLGVFSELNMDYTLALGSSSVTLYELTRAFSVFARLGKKTSPILIKKINSNAGETLIENLSLDYFFEKDIKKVDKIIAKKKLELQANQKAAATEEVDPNAEEDQERKTPEFFFDNENQLIKPTTAYLTTSILKAATGDPRATGLKASALKRPLAGKTGTTNGEFDAWFVGYTPQITTGVWVGYLSEKSLGVGEGGGKSSLPIWLEYMKLAHKDLPKEEFEVPPGITFVNIDSETGKLASENSETVIKQAFAVGTQPKSSDASYSPEDDKNFYKQDLDE